MGKVTDLLKKIREMPNMPLFDRYKKIVRAQAVREYLAIKEDTTLTVEVNLVGEEIMNRMTDGEYVNISKPATEEKTNEKNSI